MVCWHETWKTKVNSLISLVALAKMHPLDVPEAVLSALKPRGGVVAHQNGASSHAEEKIGHQPNNTCVCLITTMILNCCFMHK